MVDFGHFKGFVDDKRNVEYHHKTCDLNQLLYMVREVKRIGAYMENIT